MHVLSTISEFKKTYYEQNYCYTWHVTCCGFCHKTDACSTDLVKCTIAYMISTQVNKIKARMRCLCMTC